MTAQRHMGDRVRRRGTSLGLAVSGRVGLLSWARRGGGPERPDSGFIHQRRQCFNRSVNRKNILSHGFQPNKRYTTRPARPHDLNRQPHHRVQKRLELHPQHAPLLRALLLAASAVARRFWQAQRPTKPSGSKPARSSPYKPNCSAGRRPPHTTTARRLAIEREGSPGRNGRWPRIRPRSPISSDRRSDSRSKGSRLTACLDPWGAPDTSSRPPSDTSCGRPPADS